MIDSDRYSDVATTKHLVISGVREGGGGGIELLRFDNDGLLMLVGHY